MTPKKLKCFVTKLFEAFSTSKMTNNDDINNNNAPAQAPELTQEQLLALYQHAFTIIEQQNRDLKTVVSQQKAIIDVQRKTIDVIWDDHFKRINEIHKEHDATKEKLYQVTKKDEMKTALLKQLMQKK